MSSDGIHLNLSAKSPEAMRALFEQCMAETNELHYDGKLIRGKAGGTGQVYVFGPDCPDCKAREWRDSHLCATCRGRKQIAPTWT